jgi:ankyrin repeat protein
LLHFATKASQWDIILALLKAGADVTATNKQNQKPFDIASEEKIKRYLTGLLPKNISYIFRLRTLSRSYNTRRWKYRKRV